MSEPSWQELHDLFTSTMIARRALSGVNIQIVEGTVYDSIGAGVASVGTRLVAFGAQGFRSVFLDGAEDEDLKNVAYDRGVIKQEGARSVGAVSLSRGSFAAGAGTVIAGSRFATDPDSLGNFVVVTIDEDVTFGLTDLGPFVVNATAEQIGTDGNVGVGKIVRVLSSLFDNQIGVTNANLFAGGVQAESDEDLRDRTRGFFRTQSRGTIDALYYGARQVEGVDRVTISVDSAGVVTVYVADAEGNSNATLVAAVQEELEFWRGASDVIYVTGGTISIIEFDFSIAVRTGTDLNTLKSAIRQAVVSRMELMNPGEELSRDMIESAIRDVDRQKIVRVTQNSPSATLIPGPNELLRTTLEGITFS